VQRSPKSATGDETSEEETEAGDGGEGMGTRGMGVVGWEPKISRKYEDTASSEEETGMT